MRPRRVPCLQPRRPPRVPATWPRREPRPHLHLCPAQLQPRHPTSLRRALTLVRRRCRLPSQPPQRLHQLLRRHRSPSRPPLHSPPARCKALLRSQAAELPAHTSAHVRTPRRSRPPRPRFFQTPRLYPVGRRRGVAARATSCLYARARLWKARATGRLLLGQGATRTVGDVGTAHTTLEGV